MLSPTLSLVLASKSPRRSQLLEAAGIPFTVRTAEVEEVYPPETPGLEIAPYLARLKARGSFHLLNEGEILLAADSVVLIEGEKYGKPKSREEAVATLLLLSDSVHTVVTGCCLKDAEREEVFSSVAQVHVNVISPEEAAWYVDTYRPYDKAGAYGIQEWIGLAKVSRIEGSYPAIMGLPVAMVYERLLSWR